MTAVCFEPHQDDCALFCAFTAMHLSAHVVTVLESHLQAARGLPISQAERAAESACAMAELGLTLDEWPYRDDNPDWAAVGTAMRLLDERLEPSIVLAPLPEKLGHDDHNHVGELADTIFGERCLSYLTYERGWGRSTSPNPVEPTADQVIRKLRALACYRTQIAEPTTRPWFLGGIEEWLA